MPVAHNYWILVFCFAVPPTAVWIDKKEQHLLSGREVVYNCGSTGSSPRSKFTWFLGEDLITTTSTDDIQLHQVSLKTQLRRYIRLHSGWKWHKKGSFVLVCLELRFVTFFKCLNLIELIWRGDLIDLSWHNLTRFAWLDSLRSIWLTLLELTRFA